MSTINTFRLANLRIYEHFQFNAEFCDLVKDFGADTLKLDSHYDSYQLLFEQEDIALNKITKSALTDDILAADSLRDSTFRGMVDTNRAALNHYSAETREAARRLQIVFDSYGNLSGKSLNEETSAIYNLLQELKNRSEEVDDVALSGWVEELEKNNNDFEALVKDRYDETAQRTDFVLKEVRAKVDDAYRALTTRINALALLEESEVYEGFIRLLTVVVEKYANTLAQRAGKSKKTS